MSEPAPPTAPKNPHRSRPRYHVPQSVGQHTYRCVYTPPSCTDWTLNDDYQIWVVEPPAPSITISSDDVCNGTVLLLDEDE